jgi:hypothetical protein
VGKFRKKPVVIDAVKWTGQFWDCDDMPQWLEDALEKGVGVDGMIRVVDQFNLKVGTLEGVMTASPGDWIIRGVNGEVYPCKPDIFAATYEHTGEVLS